MISMQQDLCSGDSGDESCLPLRWYAVQVRANQEKIVAAGLRNRGINEFLPTYRCRRKWSDRIKEIEYPLFPGYVFSRFDPDRRLPILMTPGVAHIVGFHNTPAPIEDAEIEAIQSVVRSQVRAEPHPFLQVGDRIVLDAGPLAGLEGIYLEEKNRYRLVVSVVLLQRSVAVEIESDWVRPLHPRPFGVQLAARYAILSKPA